MYCHLCYSKMKKDVCYKCKYMYPVKDSTARKHRTLEFLSGQIENLRTKGTRKELYRLYIYPTSKKKEIGIVRRTARHLYPKTFRRCGLL